MYFKKSTLIRINQLAQLHYILMPVLYCFIKQFKFKKDLCILNETTNC